MLPPEEAAPWGLVGARSHGNKSVLDSLHLASQIFHLVVDHFRPVDDMGGVAVADLNAPGKPVHFSGHDFELVVDVL
ncbi:hypothetical protein N7461_002972 [Penicillium sp. DV-2018c]|nr:hypothetical protein N7461_002972 [Penicillium sp. DV-2018c]